MNPQGNTILITGASNGIGQALAREFHSAGNKVIAAARNLAALGDLAEELPGLAIARLDVTDDTGIAAFASKMAAEHPDLNVLVNNAGIMRFETGIDVAAAEETITTNLLGPIRLTAALLPQLLGTKNPAIVNVSSSLAFVPPPFSPSYGASKAGLHAWTVALRFQLAGKAEVIEIIPPAVQTELTPGQSQSAQAMPLEDYIAETLALLRTDPTPIEIVVERAQGCRLAVDDEVVIAELRKMGIPA